MAYSDYDYDDRPRYSSSRRDDYATPPPPHHHGPEYHPHEQPLRSRASVVPTDASRDSSYDPRYRNPPPPRTSSFRSERRARPRWPPQPTVENEAESLAKEHGVHTSLHGENQEGPVMRGTVDQEPIMVEVSQPKSSDNQERRFVLVPGSEAEKTAEVPLATTAGRSRRGEAADRQKAPPLKTNFEETPIYPRREPSPYAFSKPDVSSKGRSAGESWLSPDTVAPPSATRPSRRPDETAGSRKTKSSGDSFLSPNSHQNTGTLEDSDLSGDDLIKVRSERQPARYSFSPADLKKEDLRTSLRGSEPMIEKERPSGRPRSTSTAYSFGPGELRKEDPRAPPRDPEPARRQTFAQQSPSASPRAYSPPSPPASSTRRTNESSATNTPSSQHFSQDLPWARPAGSRRTTYDTLYDNTSSQRVSSNVFSRPASPVSRENSYPPSPPRSPSRPQMKRNDKKPSVETRSRPPSRAVSRATSPLQTTFAEPERAPSPPTININRSPRVATFPIAASVKDHTRRVSRQDMSASEPGRGNSLPAPRIDIQSPSPARPAKPPTSLPYPDDDMNVLMPQEDRFQYNHDSPGSPMTAGFDYPRSPSVAPNPIPSRLRDDNSPAHVPMRRTFSETSVHIEPLIERPKTRNGRSNSNTDYASSPVIKTLPPCPRPGYSSNYDDWYTIEGCSSVIVCLDCIQDIVGRSRLRDYFVRARRSDTITRKMCDLSIPWFRIAWLLTIKENRSDLNLNLIRTLAKIRDQERECPGNNRVTQVWYGVKNIHNKHVSNMFVCQRDRRYIEALLPSLNGQFTRVEMADPTVPRMCSLRTESHRFEKYMDLLVDIHDRAIKNRRTPDMQPFVELATQNAWKSECPRDNIILDGLWHIIPGHHELTVCEECYDDIIYPWLKSGNRIAEAFSRTMQPVPQETLTGIGSSCQMYSPRMRRVFQRAVKDEDLGYLVKKVRERKKIELALQAQHKALRKLDDDNNANAGYRTGYRDYHGGGGLDAESIRRELEDIAREWRDWE